MRHNLSASAVRAIVDARDSLGEARDFLQIASLAADGVRGDVGGAFGRTVSAIWSAVNAAETRLGHLMEGRDDD